MEDIKAIRNKCREAKKNLKYTNAFIAEQSETSKTTVERFLGTNDSLSFSYSSISRIVRFLIGIDDETPKDTEQLAKSLPLSPSETVEAYKEIINIRAAENDDLRKEIERLKGEHKEELSSVHARYDDAIRGRQKIIHSLIVLLCVCLLIIITLVVLDVIISNKGWIQR